MGTFANGFHCYVSLPPHKKKEWPTSCRLSILNWHFRVTHPLAPFFLFPIRGLQSIPCMSHNSRGKGQRVAIRWMRRPINVLIWIILLSVEATLRHISYFLSVSKHVSRQPIGDLCFAVVVPFSHCHERIQTARDRTTLRPDKKESAVFALP